MVQPCLGSSIRLGGLILRAGFRRSQRSSRLAEYPNVVALLSRHETTVYQDNNEPRPELVRTIRRFTGVTQDERIDEVPQPIRTRTWDGLTTNVQDLNAHSVICFAAPLMSWLLQHPRGSCACI